MAYVKSLKNILAFWVWKAGMCLATAHGNAHGSGTDRQIYPPHKQHNYTKAANCQFEILC